MESSGIAPVCGNSGTPGSTQPRSTTAVMQATRTGMKLRGFHSNSSSSTASSTAAIGVPNTAVIPALAPATSSVFRSAALMSKNWANREPSAPPVMMIGPSAPNGPPVPIEIAEVTGFRAATFGSIRLWPMRIASIASGMPWPRIFSDP